MKRETIKISKKKTNFYLKRFAPVVLIGSLIIASVGITTLADSSSTTQDTKLASKVKVFPEAMAPHIVSNPTAIPMLTNDSFIKSYLGRTLVEPIKEICTTKFPQNPNELDPNYEPPVKSAIYYIGQADDTTYNLNNDIQDYIREKCEKHNYDMKKMLGCIMAESRMNPNCVGDSGRSLGLFQIQSYWKTAPGLANFRINGEHASRDLLNPYHNIDTCIELWNYARSAYNIDLSTDQGYKDLFYWHNSGQYIKNVTWAYSDRCVNYAKTLIEKEIKNNEINLSRH